MTTPVPAKPRLAKWAMKELTINMLFFIMGFALLPSSFFVNNDQFLCVLAGLAFGIGFVRMIRLAQLDKSGKAAEEHPSLDTQ